MHLNKRNDIKHITKTQQVRKQRIKSNIKHRKERKKQSASSGMDEQESQADALLKAKRMRKATRQSMPEKGLPESVMSQVAPKQ